MKTTRRELLLRMEERRLKTKKKKDEGKNKMKEIKRQRNWDSAWRNQMRTQILGDMIVNWVNGKWKMNNQKFKMMIQKT